MSAVYNPRRVPVYHAEDPRWRDPQYSGQCNTVVVAHADRVDQTLQAHFEGKFIDQAVIFGVDSGATDHITGDFSILTNVRWVKGMSIQHLNIGW